MRRMEENNVSLGEIITIARGLASSGTSASGRKACAQRMRYKEVFSVKRPPKQA